MDHGGQGARTPTGHPQCEEVLGTHHWAWGVEGQPVGVSPWSCSWWGPLLLPGEVEGAARIPHPACGRIRPPPLSGPLRGAGGELPLECQAQVGSLTQSKKPGPGLAGT